MDGYVKLGIHIIGLALIFVQTAGLHDFWETTLSTNYVQAYTFTQIFIFGSTWLIRKGIEFVEQNHNVELVYAVHKSKVDTTVAKYDMDESDSSLSTNRIMFVVITLASFQFQLLSKFALLVLGVLRSTTMLTSPLFKVYVLKYPAVGSLQRPWAPDETFIRFGDPVPFVDAIPGSETVATEKEAEPEKGVSPKKAGKKGSKKNQ
ncbi:hypothetical protein BC830DRAFT_1229225 [Chytriomyces sp. MP71]|nr:hypothetical protein BC830DRAFT_1229225 [Chytriomyces sp. MP71]